MFELVVAGGRNSQDGIDIIMVEAGSTPNGLRLIAEAMPPRTRPPWPAVWKRPRPTSVESIDLQNELVAQVAKKEVEWPVAVDYTDEIYERVNAVAEPKLASVITIAEKQGAQRRQTQVLRR